MSSSISFPRACDVLANSPSDEKSRHDRIARARHAKREATFDFMTQHRQQLLDVMVREMTKQLHYIAANATGSSDVGAIVDEHDVEFIALRLGTTNLVLQGDHSFLRGALKRLFDDNIVSALQAAGWGCDCDSFECYFDGVYRICGTVCC